MARAHVIDASGTLRTGISGFTHVWATLPYWRHLAWVLQVEPQSLSPLPSPLHPPHHLTSHPHLAWALQTVPLATAAAEAAYGFWSGARLRLQAGDGVSSAGASARSSPGASCRFVPGQKGPPPDCQA